MQFAALSESIDFKLCILWIYLYKFTPGRFDSAFGFNLSLIPICTMHKNTMTGTTDYTSKYPPFINLKCAITLRALCVKATGSCARSHHKSGGYCGSRKAAALPANFCLQSITVASPAGKIIAFIVPVVRFLMVAGSYDPVTAVGGWTWTDVFPSCSNIWKRVVRSHRLIFLTSDELRLVYCKVCGCSSVCLLHQQPGGDPDWLVEMWHR